MAKGFASHYGSDVLVADSAGVAPAMAIPSLTRKVMLEKNIELGESIPKGLDLIDVESTEIIINMSGYPLELETEARVEDWKIRDPIGEREEIYREVRDQIEQRVMRLILELRARKPPAAEPVKVDSRRRTPRS
jgi:arsenate reductase